MANLICDYDALRFLTSKDIELEAGGVEFANLLNFMQSRSGDWEHRGTEESDLIREGGTFPPGTLAMTSPRFETEELRIAVVQSIWSWIGDKGYMDGTNYGAFVVLTAAAYTGPMFDGLRNAYTTDEPPVLKNWDQWKDATHNHYRNAASTQFYVPLNSDTGSNDTAMSLLAAMSAGGYIVLGMEEFPEDAITVI